MSQEHASTDVRLQFVCQGSEILPERRDNFGEERSDKPQPDRWYER